MAQQWSLFLSLSLLSLFLVTSKAQVPAIFIFGDSTVDVGTNNNLNATRAKADMPYNGIDYPYSTPTGRFSNGYNTADLIVRLLTGFHVSPQPYLSLQKNPSTLKRDVLRGVNFASGGSGILDHTGFQPYVEVISLGQQILQFAEVRGNITDVLQQPKTDTLISNAMFIVSVGSNDLFDYQRYNSTTMPSEILITNLQDAYGIHLQNLYNLGARKFGIVSVPPIGCCPAERALNSTGVCFEAMNDLAQAFYASTETLLQQFSTQLQGVKYSLGNAYQMIKNIIDNPRASGFKDVETACCGNGTIQCTPAADLCNNRNDYLFWDLYHPTQAASKLAALTLAYADGHEFVTPMNFSSLAAVNI